MRKEEEEKGEGRELGSERGKAYINNVCVGRGACVCEDREVPLPLCLCG